MSFGEAKCPSRGTFGSLDSSELIPRRPLLAPKDSNLALLPQASMAALRRGFVTFPSFLPSVYPVFHKQLSLSLSLFPIGVLLSLGLWSHSSLHFSLPLPSTHRCFPRARLDFDCTAAWRWNATDSLCLLDTPPVLLALAAGPPNRSPSWGFPLPPPLPLGLPPFLSLPLL